MKVELSSARGSVAIIFVGLFLPLIFFLFSLTLDVATYYTDQAKVQTALDESALYAYRFLPNITAAQDAALNYAARFTGMEGLTAEVSDSAVVLRVNRRSQLTFAKLVGVSDATLPLSVVSRVRGAPVDALVVLDTSSAVAPVFGASGWGSLGEWPAAQFFDDLGGVSAREKTQRCFNPVFSALKSAAIDTYRYLGASSVNSVGLGFYSGVASSPLVSAREVAPLPRLPATPPEVSFIGFADPYVGPSLCAAAAQAEVATPQYRFPEGNTDLPARGSFAGRPYEMISPSTRNIDPAYLPFLQGEELIWSQAAASDPATGSAIALRTALLSVLAGERAAGRGGLSARPSRMLVWLTSQLPSEGGVQFGSTGDGQVRATLSALFAGTNSGFGDTGITIFYVVLKNGALGFDPSSALLGEFQDSLITAAQTAGIRPGLVTVRVLGIDQPSQLTDALSRWLAVAGKTTVVAL
jgi:hypothetical protein